MTSELVREGRVWCFGNEINTDLIFPVAAMELPEADQHRLVFSANRPGWVDQVEPGDLVVAGTNFGTGSGRPVGRLLGALGIGAVVAESVNGLALRNCISFAMPAMNCADVLAIFNEGDRAHVDFIAGHITNLRTGRSLSGAALPPLLVDIIEAGGVLRSLARDGLIALEASVPVPVTVARRNP